MEEEKNKEQKQDTSPKKEEEYDDEEEEEVEDEKKTENNNIDELQSIQNEIEEMTKKVEHEKISLRTYKERYEKAFNHYCELKGLPVPLTKEQQQKEREKHMKSIKKHKVADPIIHKKTKLGASLEIEAKKARQLKLNTLSVENLEDDINVLTLNNDQMKEEIKNLRQDKTNALQQKQKMQDKIDELQENINAQKEKNENSEKEIKHEEYKQAVSDNKELNKNFVEQRDQMEEEYHKIIEESIKRERELKKEQAKKRQMNSMVSDSKAAFKGSNTIELEKYVKALKNEEISDRTPILSKLLDKWKEINKATAEMVAKYSKNAAGIKQIFDEIQAFYGLDSYGQIPIVIKKSLSQMQEIQSYLTRLNSECSELQGKKELLQNQIEYLKAKSEEDELNEKTMTGNRKEFLRFLQEKICKVKGDLAAKKRLFNQIKPNTDSFLGKMNESYMADYVNDKVNIQPEIEYNYKDVERVLSSVEDYYKLIQMYSDKINGKEEPNADEELEKLREEIKFKLENLDAKKYISNNLRISMKNDHYKNGLDFDDIIKRSSEMICSQVSKSVALTEGNASLRQTKRKMLAPLEAC
ncbi:MAG: hypothetical protein MJ252_26210 [archaeon]|nr:hypothetical protein [archaeon]